MPDHRHGASEPQQIGGQTGGHGGQKTRLSDPKRAAELERTTGFEPATLTLAKKKPTARFRGFHTLR